ncbi:MAG: Uma2 family endonuclease [Roseiarcus sp.]
MHNCAGELHARLKGTPCRVAGADTALRTAIRTARRPDVTIDCSDPRDDSYESHRPTVVVEILSPSTSKIDRFTKLEEYRRHPTIRHILLVDPDIIAAVHYFRLEGGEGTDVELRGAEAVIEFTAIDVTLPLGALYDRLETPGLRARAQSG